MATVRLSIRPDEPAEVPDEEVPVLRQQGLLIEDEPAPARARGGKPTGSAAGAGEDT